VQAVEMVQATPVEASSSAGAPHSTLSVERELEAALKAEDERLEAEQRKVFSKFNMEEKLGAGTFGIVFLARSKADGAMRAVKCIAKEAQDLAALDNEIAIMRAANTAMGIGPSYVVTLYETYEGPEHYYLVMEALSGGEVYKRLGALPDGKYTEADARAIAKQLLLGCYKLHAAGILHRDLKPENLLYATTAADSPIKIADFGLSCFYEDVFHVKDVCGTPLYFAPELLVAGEEHDFDDNGFPCTYRRSYGPSVDVWACGCLLYQLLSGRTPFEPEWRPDEEGWDFEPMNKVILDREYDIVEATKDWKGVSIGARSLLSQMLDADPTRRPTSAACLEVSTRPPSP